MSSKAENGPFTGAQLAQLMTPLDPKMLGPRSGAVKGDYIPAFRVIAEANNLIGYGGWGVKIVSEEYLGSKEVFKKNGNDKHWISAYNITVEISVVGMPPRQATGGDSAFGALEMESRINAKKGAESIAIKRALRYFGPRFGLLLYGDDSQTEFRLLVHDQSSEQFKDLLEEAKSLAKTAHNDGWDSTVELLNGKTLEEVLVIKSVRNPTNLIEYVETMRSKLGIVAEVSE